MPEQRVDDVAAIQLTDGQKVQCGDKQTEPSRERDRMQHDVVIRGDRSDDEPLQQKIQERVSLRESIEALYGLHGRNGKPVHDRRNGQSQTGQRPRGADVEQCPPIRDGRSDADHRTQRADQGVGHGDKIGECGPDVPFSGCKVVSELVNAEDKQQRGGEGKPSVKLERSRKWVDAPVHCSHCRRGKHGGQKKDHVDPRPGRLLRGEHLPVLRP